MLYLGAGFVLDDGRFLNGFLCSRSGLDTVARDWFPHRCLDRIESSVLRLVLFPGSGHNLPAPGPRGIHIPLRASAQPLEGSMHTSDPDVDSAVYGLGPGAVAISGFQAVAHLPSHAADQSGLALSAALGQ